MQMLTVILTCFDLPALNFAVLLSNLVKSLATSRQTRFYGVKNYGGGGVQEGLGNNVFFS